MATGHKGPHHFAGRSCGEWRPTSSNDECPVCPARCPGCGATWVRRGNLDHRPLDNHDLHGVVEEIRDRAHSAKYTEPDPDGSGSGAFKEEA